MYNYMYLPCTLLEHVDEVEKFLAFKLSSGFGLPMVKQVKSIVLDIVFYIGSFESKTRTSKWRENGACSTLFSCCFRRLFSI